MASPSRLTARVTAMRAASGLAFPSFAAISSNDNCCSSLKMIAIRSFGFNVRSAVR